MDEVIIKAFQQNRMLKDVPAAVNYIGPSLLQSFGTSSIVQAVNAHLAYLRKKGHQAVIGLISEAVH
ncbi:MAG: hypothetical protein NVS1B13_16500 [Flavisolibacter sp.]